MSKSIETKRCIICFEKAVCWSGHIHNGTQLITAGFCKEHSQVRTRERNKRDDCKMGWEGCYGVWDKRMGEYPIIKHPKGYSTIKESAYQHSDSNSLTILPNNVPSCDLGVSQSKWTCIEGTTSKNNGTQKINCYHEIIDNRDR